ncbi:PREDICTED: dynein light chain roadblock-type 2 [Cyprinodon variegatus]|uniref:Dynein light chain roadblock-type 2 n=1 Tax=Cyprinodon variegatus TaxID=28743 RepID=A0A3Q2DW97_CYPVA|nr:PREDICTED: dynein light chain roadblock-type 2 [Cyprinodon variegatus]
MDGVEETLKRIESNASVAGTIVLNSEGVPIRSSFDSGTSSRYGREVSEITALARSAVRDLDPQNDLQLLCIRFNKREIIIGAENNCLLIVFKNLPE